MGMMMVDGAQVCVMTLSLLCEMLCAMLCAIAVHCVPLIVCAHAMCATSTPAPSEQLALLNYYVMRLRHQ